MKPGVTLTEAEQKQIVDQLSAQQDALKGQIQALGGTILNDFQYAYNGIKVSIARDKVSDLQKLTGVVGVHAVARVERDNVNTAPLVNAPAVWGGSPAFHGAGVKIADHRHRHRLHACQLRWSRHGGGVQCRGGYEHAPGESHPLRAERGHEGEGRVRLRRRRLQRRPRLTDLPADPASGSQPARLRTGTGATSRERPQATASSRTARRTRGPWNASTISSHTWNIGPGMAPQANAVRASRVRLRGLDRRHRRRDRVGRREPHGHHQHVARLAVR